MKRIWAYWVEFGKRCDNNEIGWEILIPLGIGMLIALIQIQLGLL